MKKQRLKLFWGEMQQLKKPKWLLNNSLGTWHGGGSPLRTFQKKKTQFIEAFTALRALGSSGHGIYSQDMKAGGLFPMQIWAGHIIELSECPHCPWPGCSSRAAAEITSWE